MKDTEYWQRDDIVARLRMEASINQGNAKLCGEAADEIERLRITGAEREAIKDAIDCCQDITYGEEASPEAAAMLRGLLERLG